MLTEKIKIEETVHDELKRYLEEKEKILKGEYEQWQNELDKRRVELDEEIEKLKL